MRSLSELQERFSSALIDAESALNATGIFRGPSETTLARLAIYRGNTYANFTKALASAYPVVREIVGEEFFAAMARQFVRQHPSRSGDLNRYGEQLPDFLETFPHTADLPYLQDVAKMEWLVHRAHFAADPPPFDPSSLAQLEPAQYSALRPKLSAACALFESAWPLARLWTIHQDDYRGGFEVDLSAGPDRVLVCRTGWRCQALSLMPGDFLFLCSASRNATLVVALEAALEADAGFDPSTALAHWINAQVITGLV